MTDRQVGPTGEQVFSRAAHDRLDEFDVGMRALLAEAVETGQQQPDREDHIHAQRDLRLPSGRDVAGQSLEPVGVGEQLSCLPVEQRSGGRQGRTTPLELEGAQAQGAFQALDRVGDGRLALVERLGRALVATLFDHGDQGAPLFETDPGRRLHISKILID